MKKYGNSAFVVLFLLTALACTALLWQQTTAQQPVIPGMASPVTTIQLPGAAVVPPRMLAGYVTFDNPQTGQKSQRVTLIDPESKRICVYAIHLGGPHDAKIELLSVRHIQTDLQIEVFNGMDPMPSQLEEQIKRSPTR